MTVYLSHTGGQVAAVIDNADQWVLDVCPWRAHLSNSRSRTLYVSGKISGKRVYLHRLILDAPKGVGVDHINGDGLDNRRENLRLASQQDNMANVFTRKTPGKKSRFKGVSRSSRGTWFAYVNKDRVHYHIGYFAGEEEAAVAYNTRAVELFGTFARPNVMDSTV